VSEYRARQAANAGAKAFRDGKPRSANNRPHGTYWRDCWNDGFDHAENEAIKENDRG
jgi:hypothetical protein